MQLDDLKPSELRDPYGYSVKWHNYPEDVLAMWVADMDFPIAQEIKKAITERLTERIGYPKWNGDTGLLEAILAQQAGFGLTGLAPENLWLTSSVVPAIYASVMGLSSPGDEVITQVPVYHPFHYALAEQNRISRHNNLVPTGHTWEIDFDQLESLVGPGTRMLMLCNPQNPTGRVFSKAELEKLADFALRHRLYIMSDELWAELIYEGQHTPIASLSPEVAQRTVTLTGPCKAFNTAGLGGGVAISHNKEILARMQKVTKGVMAHANVLSMVAWKAGLEQGRGWLSEIVAYLKSNRDYISEFVAREMPQVGYSAPQGTYLAFLDFSHFPFAKEVNKVMLEQAKLGLNDGVLFGPNFQGWVRLNFATGREILHEALERMAKVARSVD